MSPALSLLLNLLRLLARGLVRILDARLSRREAWLRARIAALPVGHRRRAGLEAELAKAARARAVLEDSELWEDARWIGLAAEAARAAADAGRRGWVRLRWIWGWATRFRRLPRALAVPCATLEPPEERCTTYIGVI